MNEEQAHLALTEMLFGWMNTTAIMAAAEFGLPDTLAAGTRTAAELADELGADEARLGRFLRTLTAAGVVVRAGDGRFALGPLGEPLRSDVAGSLRNVYRMIRGPIGQAMLSGHTGVGKGAPPAFETIFGMPGFEYLAQNPEYSRVLNAAMAEFGAAMGTPAIGAYDFSGVRTLVDVGGGRGQLAAEVLRRYPDMEGVVFDQPHVVEEAEAAIKEAGLSPRCRAVGGDFFTSVPAGGDCYAMRWIIHDWDDERAGTILRCCREAIDPAGRLLLFEMVMPEEDGPHPAKLLDYIMLSVITGQERTETEYAALLAANGFRLTRVVPSPTPMSVVEAVPA